MDPRSNSPQKQLYNTFDSTGNQNYHPKRLGTFLRNTSKYPVIPITINKFGRIPVLASAAQVLELE